MSTFSPLADLPFDFSSVSVHIPKGTRVYRGQTDAFDIELQAQGPSGQSGQPRQSAYLRRPIITQNRHAFFGLRPQQTTINYGITAELEVRADLILINITNPVAYVKLRSVMEKKSPETVASLERAFLLRAGRVYRNSIKRDDFLVLDFLCTFTPFEGYIQPRIATADGGHMHAEMAICAHSHGKITPVSQRAIAPPKGATYSSLLRDYKIRLTQQARLRAVKQLKQARARERTQLMAREDQGGGPSSFTAAKRLKF